MFIGADNFIDYCQVYIEQGGEGTGNTTSLRMPCMVSKLTNTIELVYETEWAAEEQPPLHTQINI